MLDQGVRDNTGDGDFVEFQGTGAQAKGQFRCADCGYGVTVRSALPVCPMCGGESWERAAWSPFARTAAWTL
jgi:rubrerythrin